MEITIGIADSSRQLTVTVEESPDEVQKKVLAALSGDDTLQLTDDKGRRVIVPAPQIAFVEIGPADSRRVGFASAD